MACGFCRARTTNERTFRNQFVCPPLCPYQDTRVAISAVGSVVQALPEEVRVRRAVGEGIGRGLRDNYTDHESEPMFDYIQDLIARLEQVQWRSQSDVANRRRDAS